MKQLKLSLIHFSILSGLIMVLPVQADHSGGNEEQHKHHHAKSSHEHKHNQHKHEQILVQEAYIRATPPGAKNSAAYFTLINHTNEDLLLTGASSSVAKTTELHNHFMADGAMSMRQIKSAHLPANKKVLFQPGGLHVMLFDLSQPLVAGDTATLTLTFHNGEKVELMANILAPDDIVNPHSKHKKGHGHHQHSGHDHH
ncbi:copper chaperone PCu(A)C [Marinomonas agarivorans]|nr:copper chaperone PCu(A)C [Marinomonas agarivorans]